jgi:hypothetical protein
MCDVAHAHAHAYSIFMQVLEALGASQQQEAVDPQSKYSIDCLVHAWNGQTDLKIAVEADGPTHYVDDCALGNERWKRANGATVMKHRHLGMLGYAVVSLPFWEWGVLLDDEAKRAYLLLKLAAAVDVRNRRT